MTRCCVISEPKRTTTLQWECGIFPHFSFFSVKTFFLNGKTPIIHFLLAKLLVHSLKHPEKKTANYAKNPLKNKMGKFRHDRKQNFTLNHKGIKEGRPGNNQQTAKKRRYSAKLKAKFEMLRLALGGIVHNVSRVYCVPNNPRNPLFKY